MNREEHLVWCKRRALEYVDEGDLSGAVASMLSDMNKHSETELSSPVLSGLGMLYVINGDVDGVRRWITGFN